MSQPVTRIDMTQGSILSTTIRFALPICAGNVLQQLYSTVDTLVIGNFCDSTALAAVATSSQPLEILLCVFLGIGSGVSILVSQAAGQSDTARQQTLARTAVWFLYTTAIPLTVIGLLAGPLLLRLMQVPEDAWPGAVLYLRITTLGCLGNMGYNLNAGLLRGLGNSQATLWMLVISCFVNIVGDLVLVGVFGLGVGGAAAATAAAMMLAWAFSIVYLLRHAPELAFPVLPKGYDRATLREILHVGLPLGLNNALYSFGHLMLQTLYNTQGSVFVAGCSVASKISSLANVAITSFSSAASVFSGQNFGAGLTDRLRRGALRIPLACGAFTLAAGLLLTLFRLPVLTLFTRDEAVLAVAARYVVVVLPFTWCYAVFNGIINYVNGLGEIRYDRRQPADSVGRAYPLRLAAGRCWAWRLLHGGHVAELCRRNGRHAPLLPHPPLGRAVQPVQRQCKNRLILCVVCHIRGASSGGSVQPSGPQNPDRIARRLGADLIISLLVIMKSILHQTARLHTGERAGYKVNMRQLAAKFLLRLPDRGIINVRVAAIVAADLNQETVLYPCALQNGKHLFKALLIHYARRPCVSIRFPLAPEDQAAADRPAPPGQIAARSPQAFDRIVQIAAAGQPLLYAAAALGCRNAHNRHTGLRKPCIDKGRCQGTGFHPQIIDAPRAVFLQPKRFAQHMQVFRVGYGTVFIPAPPGQARHRLRVCRIGNAAPGHIGLPHKYDQIHRVFHVSYRPFIR